MSQNLENKKVVLSGIADKIARAKSMVVVDYNGVTVAEDTALRKKMRESNIEYVVLKNTLVKRAFHDIGNHDFDEALNGPSAFAFSYDDEVAAAKTVAECGKGFKDKFKVKCGYVDGGYLDVNGVNALAALPSKEELVAKLMGSMNAPASNFVGVAQNIIGGFVRCLNAVKEQMQG